MAIFTEKGHGAPETETGLSIIGTGMRVVGDITAEGVVKIEGTVVGTVRAGRQVLVGKGGEVEGDVISREAIIGGDVRGARRHRGQTLAGARGRRDQRGGAYGRDRLGAGSAREGGRAAVLLIRDRYPHAGVSRMWIVYPATT